MSRPLIQFLEKGQLHQLLATRATSELHSDFCVFPGAGMKLA